MTQTFLFKSPPQTAKEKPCFKCGATLPLEAFYTHPRMADGHLNKCKACAKRDVREHRASNKAYYRLYDAYRFRKNPKRKRLRDEYAGTETGRQKALEAKARWSQRNKHKRNAQNRLRRAVQSGRILKPDSCESCGRTSDSSRLLHAHHEDYSKPLSVEWLCPSCHGFRHTRHKGVAMGMSVEDLADIQQLLDVGTEEAIADIWTRYELTHAQAVDLTGQQPIQRWEDAY